MKMNNKKIIFFIWVSIIWILFLIYLSFPKIFTPEYLQKFFSDNILLTSIVYLIIWTIRWFFLLPSTPIVLTWVLVLPANLLFVLNFICIITSSLIVYYWWKYLNFDKYFNKKYPKEIKKLEHALRKKELPFITLWWFFPFVPTDMIIFVAEVLHIRLWKILLWVLIWELILCYFYIYWGSEILSYFMS